MHNQKIANYIKKSSTTIPNKKETLFFKDIIVYIKDPLPEGILLKNVLDRIEQTIPKHLGTNIDAIYVGTFEHLESREVNAAYLDGALYISNEQDDEEDLLDDILHELAHSVEEKYGLEIYGSGKLEKEFIRKRISLFNSLRAYDYDVKKSEFLTIDFTEDFDNLLYKDIGYDKLEHFTMGLFPSNYSVTSLREYFAIGFEKFFLGDAKELSKISPTLFGIIEQLITSGEENEEEIWLNSEQHYTTY